MVEGVTVVTAGITAVCGGGGTWLRGDGGGDSGGDGGGDGGGGGGGGDGGDDSGGAWSRG